MLKDSNLIPLAKLLVMRLERLSADSKWAHQASGVRGDLIKLIEALELPESNSEELMANKREQIKYLMKFSFDILERAARDLL